MKYPKACAASILPLASVFAIMLRLFTASFGWRAITAAFLALLFIAYCAHELWWKRRHLPPGPTPWLIAGNMPQILLMSTVGGVSFERVFVKWKQQYGAEFTFWMGPIPMVMIGEVEIMRHYFVKHGDVFSGRWQNFITHTFMDGHNGVVQIQGDKWREQRRFSLHVLRNFGFGKALMEEKIWSEVDALIKHMDKIILASHPQDSEAAEEPSAVADLTEPIAVCIANIINNILFGRTYDHEDEEFIQLQRMLDQQSALVVKPIMGVYLTCPWTVNVPLLNGRWRQMLRIRKALWAFLEKHLEEHYQAFREKEYTPDLPQRLEEPSDFTFAYLAEMERRRKDGEPPGFFDRKQLKMLLLDLFFAGSETTVTTTKWGILLLALHPEWQRRCQQEIEEHLDTENQHGETRRVQLKERNKLVTLQATLCEIQRMANILPINLLRTCTEGVRVDQYFYPEGTIVLPQISIAMGDPEVFPSPEKFNPERFLQVTPPSGRLALRRIDAFLPFSIGKRQCLGESLARAELFLIFANLLANFELVSAVATKSGEPPSMERVFGLTSGPKHFTCRFRRRRRRR